MTFDQDTFARAAAFYSNSPTGQYDEEAEHALDMFWEMLEALRRVQAVYKIDDPYVNDAIANAENVD